VWTPSKYEVSKQTVVQCQQVFWLYKKVERDMDATKYRPFELPQMMVETL
jgi:hypothetical protein